MNQYYLMALQVHATTTYNLFKVIDNYRSEYIHGIKEFLLVFFNAQLFSYSFFYI